MRYVALLLTGLLCAVFAAPDFAMAAPALRYSVEAEPGTDGDPPAGPLPAPDTAAAPVTPVETGASPPLRTASAQAAPALRYSVEAEGEQPPSAPDSPPESVPASPRYSAGVPPAQPAPQVPPQTEPQQQPQQQVASIAPETVTVTGYRGYQLGPGDKVHVTVYGETDLTGDFEVSGAGRVAFPLIGDVRAAGLTAPQLGDRLTALLGNGYLINPRVSVEVTTYRPFYVVGEVNRPGSFPYTDGMTALNAIALAGGFTPSASEGSVYIRHAGETSEVRMPIDDVTEIEPGDVIRIDESTFWSVMRILSPLTAAAANARYGIP